MYKYLKNLLIYSLILIYSCTDGVKIHEVTSLEENKNFNAIINGFNKIIETSRKETKKHERGEKRLLNYDHDKFIINSYDKFISWIEDNPDKKKELDTDFTEAYNLLEQRRTENAPEKTLDEYISDAFECYNNPSSCKDTRKQYGTKKNQIFLFFGCNFSTLFHSKNTPETVFLTLKQIDISDIKDKF
ncbi:Mlp lipoprotein family protein (plasmid) [Borrelia crocidurae DOU]|uniref:Mlp lipoprotein family protein n=1 Tax=Borrelia crocidurae DOU TaxID=1293575 RepID=W5SJZ1_9SPIR|nr:Mlp family lipoprotein [Borrelia crocidurae]AHH06963.1 Mlp lipoprotein family protein [Borrelia crocidurae DOU]